MYTKVCTKPTWVEAVLYTTQYLRFSQRTAIYYLSQTYMKIARTGGKQKTWLDKLSLPSPDVSSLFHPPKVRVVDGNWCDTNSFWSHKSCCSRIESAASARHVSRRRSQLMLQSGHITKLHVVCLTLGLNGKMEISSRYCKLSNPYITLEEVTWAFVLSQSLLNYFS